MQQRQRHADVVDGDGDAHARHQLRVKWLGVERVVTFTVCPECQGTRLNRAARFVFVADRSLPETAHLTVGQALEVFSSMHLEGWRAEVPLIEEYYAKFGDRMPQALTDQAESLGKRLG